MAPTNGGYNLMTNQCRWLENFKRCQPFGGSALKGKLLVAE
jgi:hypothetical protein